MIFLEDRFNSIPRLKDIVHLNRNDIENTESNIDTLENFEPRKSKELGKEKLTNQISLCSLLKGQENHHYPFIQKVILRHFFMFLVEAMKS